ncbi:hypothetical protein BU23DRAFT_603611 [Bimuria novae-zelandiae CBS 107.79]|uniref:Uncharacterized protein n=1 Tax=Bimuria novae-zelandiae CBS 107.79 TaxID=1447943 RepID=A0A6A5UN85_9PLEO|nr:hypothetical protein BU23DRAFT_603611 [Bimuria novae-zelandiae CBS 107.79]
MGFRNHRKPIASFEQPTKSTKMEAQMPPHGTPIHPESPTQLLAKVKESIIRSEECAQQQLAFIDDMEDRYRHFGLIYHSTSMSARNSSRLDANSMRRLQTAYTDFNVFSQPYAEVQKLLQLMLDECRPNGTLQALQARSERILNLADEIDRRLLDPANEALGLNAVSAVLSADLNLLKAEYYRQLNEGRANRWHTSDPVADKERGFCMPATLGEEWEIFKQSLDVLASEVLYKTPGEDYDSHWDALTVYDSEDDSGDDNGDDSDDDLPIQELVHGDEDNIIVEDLTPAAFPSSPTLGTYGSSHQVTPHHRVLEDGFVDDPQ